MLTLVTGASGFVGSALTQALLNLNYEVIATGVRDEQPIPKEAHFFSHGLIGVNFTAIDKLIGDRRLDVLFHEAAINHTDCDDEAEMEWANVSAAKVLFHWAHKRHGCRKIIYASSTAVYGNSLAPHYEDGSTNPLNCYGRSKWALEQTAEGFAWDHAHVYCIGLRYCNIYGPGENHKGKRASMIYQMGKAIQRGDKATLFRDGNQKRDWIFIDDVVRANLLAMECNNTCIVNCGSGVATTFNQLNLILAKLFEQPACETPHYIDNPAQSSYQSHTQCDMKLAVERLRFEPHYDIETGIRTYYERGGFDD